MGELWNPDLSLNLPTFWDIGIHWPNFAPIYIYANLKYHHWRQLIETNVTERRICVSVFTWPVIEIGLGCALSVNLQPGISFKLSWFSMDWGPLLLTCLNTHNYINICCFLLWTHMRQQGHSAISSQYICAHTNENGPLNIHFKNVEVNLVHPVHVF